MGRLKALLPFGSVTVIEQVVQPLFCLPLVKIFAVLGHRATDISVVLRPLPLHLLYNPNYVQGMTTSVQVALRQIVPVPDAYLFALVDQPHLGSGPAQAVLSAFQMTRKGLIMPTYGGKRGHPLVISAHYREEILGLGPQQGLNVVTRGHPEDTLEVPVDSDTILRDMDYPEEYEAELQRWQSQSQDP
jgi:CTP:molybdopterin cytidylyltransferase MocA